MKKIRTIKRYQNRKLYDTHQSCYVTLEEIAQIVRDGHEIQVIDNRTREDITFMTQIQLLFDRERKMASAEDVELLKRVIRSKDGTFTGHIKGLESIMREAGQNVVQKDENDVKAPFSPSFVPKTEEINTVVGEASNTLN